MSWIDTLRAPLFVSWQMTRDCDLACLHCCTDSAPGKRLPDELSRDEAMALAAEIVREDVPYVMLCGGEPLLVPHFLDVAEYLGQHGVQLKIETNGQRLDDALVARLARLPIRSIQISLDADTEEVYRRQRPGASLAKAHDACRAVRRAGLPLEVTFAPTRLNLHQAKSVLERAVQLGAFRFNTGRLMHIGRAARLWDRLSPSADDYVEFRRLLDSSERRLQSAIEICRFPFSTEDGLQASLAVPPATMLILPNGSVKVAAALGLVCGDVRQMSLQKAWTRYRAAWQNETVIAAVRQAIADESSHAAANTWTSISSREVEPCLT
jgi:MoaA/NifB/PqqE/SkfB family radical SAM enzyme